jgi:hypothetical protein
VHIAAKAVQRTFLGIHNLAAISELEHAAGGGMGATADHVTPSPSFTGKCENDNSAT